uniref:Uncharacterized protein n=1 Tax=Pyxicephalus adspersus TaxID=30357 RepID=A0AAV2ZPF5_PYXAD|nr:TPA: hypothetical protein GDO54_003174 [Pyxicephalus adspersus]
MEAILDSCEVKLTKLLRVQFDALATIWKPCRSTSPHSRHFEALLNYLTTQWTFGSPDNQPAAIVKPFRNPTNLFSSIPQPTHHRHCQNPTNHLRPTTQPPAVHPRLSHVQSRLHQGCWVL